MCLIGFNKFSFQHFPNSLGSLKLQGLRKRLKKEKKGFDSWWATYACKRKIERTIETLPLLPKTVLSFSNLLSCMVSFVESKNRSVRATTWNQEGEDKKQLLKAWVYDLKNYGDRGENLRSKGTTPISKRVRDTDHQGIGIPLILPRTETSLSWWKFARRGRQEIKSGFCSSHDPFRFDIGHSCAYSHLCSFNKSVQANSF